MSAEAPSLFETVLRRDRWVGLGALLAFAALAWWYLLSGAGMDVEMMSMPGMAPMAWTPGYAVLVFVMWWAMMVAMMLPSAAPMILLYGLVDRRRASRGGASVPSSVFALGYLTVWGAFSLLATALQWQLEALALLSPSMKASSTVLGGLVLVAAGAYQLSRWKDTCLAHCRGPVEFLSAHWRPGALGAWRMGVAHGLYCLGCCWVLMALLFYGGVMNVYWILGLTLYVFVEKLAPGGSRVGRLAGLALIGWGVAVLAGAAG